MAVNITFKTPQKQKMPSLPFGMTSVPVVSDFDNHYTLYAQNERYENRTELGSIKLGKNGKYIITVLFREFEVCGWQLQHDEQQTDRDDLLQAATDLYLHRIRLIEEGTINE